MSLHDALKPVSLLSLTLQDDHINVVQGIKYILQSHSSLKKLTSQDPIQWPTTKAVFSRLKDENGGKVYQGAELQHFTAILTQLPLPKPVQIKP